MSIITNNRWAGGRRASVLSTRQAINSVVASTFDPDSWSDEGQDERHPKTHNESAGLMIYVKVVDGAMSLPLLK